MFLFTGSWYNLCYINKSFFRFWGQRFDWRRFYYRLAVNRTRLIPILTKSIIIKHVWIYPELNVKHLVRHINHNLFASIRFSDNNAKYLMRLLIWVHYINFVTIYNLRSISGGIKYIALRFMILRVIDK